MKLPPTIWFLGNSILLVAILSACTTTGRPVLQTPNLIFRFQVGTVTNPDETDGRNLELMVSMRGSDGTCQPSSIHWNSLITMLGGDPTGGNNSAQMANFDSCSSSWVLPDKHTEDFRVFQNPGNPNLYQATVTVRDMRTDSPQNPQFWTLILDVNGVPANTPCPTLRAGTAQLIDWNTNTPRLTTQGAPLVQYFRYYQEVLDLNSTPRRGVARFQFLAGNASDRSDHQVAIVYGGSFSLEPKRWQRSTPSRAAGEGTGDRESLEYAPA